MDGLSVLSLSTFSLSTLADFHFLRPLWLLALLPALLGTWLVHRRQTDAGNWAKVISPQLLPYLVDQPTQSKQRNRALIWLIGWMIASIGMAGPTVERIPLPVHKPDSALVIAFDLSPSMLSQDLKPSRLSRARLKLIDLLNSRKEGTTGLIVYSGDAFVVSPLTDDAETVIAQVPALTPNILPSRGSNVESAVEKAVELILNTGQTSGDILLITDGVSTQAVDSLNALFRSLDGFQLSIYGVGTAEGAPIPLSGGGFAKSASGDIVMPKLNAERLQKLASRHNGHYVSITADNTDINQLNRYLSATPAAPTKQLERTFDSWHDLGYWAALLILPLLLAAFRKGQIAVLMLATFAGFSLTAPPVSAFEFTDLWLTKDQQAARALESGDAEQAAELFENPQWKAAAAYKNGDYETAESLFNNNTATSHYNRGNALAKAGKLEEAIEAYKQSLPRHLIWPMLHITKPS